MKIVITLLLLATSLAVTGPKQWEEVLREFMRGAQLDHYVEHSVACVDAIDATGRAMQRMARLSAESKDVNSTVEVYPDVVLAGTDLMATFSPLARQCFYSSVEAKNDFKHYIDQFESFSDYVGIFGTSALANYNELKELFNTFLYDVNFIHNSTQAGYHLGKFLNLLLNVKPEPQPEPTVRSE